MSEPLRPAADLNPADMEKKSGWGLGARDTVLFLGYVLVVIVLTAIRPIHQDDGWYASAAYALYNRIPGVETLSTWDYSLAGVESAGGGFVYSVYQLPFIAAFGPGIVYTKVLVVLTAVAALLFLVKFFREYAGDAASFLPLLLLAWPGFWYHFYNRPELLAVMLGFAGLYLLAGRHNRKPVFVAVAFSLPFLMFDTHPISVFLVFGFYVWFFFARADMRVAALAGSAVGLVVYLNGNWVVHGSLGILNGLIGPAVSRGDHYIPVLESGLPDILNIAVARFSVHAKVLVASLLWIPLLVYRHSVRGFVSPRWLPWLSSCVGFVVLSSLFSEAVSNGFQLYAAIAVFSIVFLLLLFVSSHASRTVTYAAMLPIGALLLYANFNYLPTYRNYIRFASTVADEYPRLARCLDGGERSLMRPTYAFATARSGNDYEYTVGLLFFMKHEDIGFAEAVYRKGYDIVAFDPDDRGFLWSDVERIDPWGGSNWYYNAIADVAIDAAEFDSMVEHRVLVPICSFDDISHGYTEFFEVDKPRLRTFVSSSRTL
jgi:hypothetical protein